jgi:hypothetical protein
MSPDFALSALNFTEFLLWAVLAFVFWKKALIHRFPAMAAYLGLHLVATPTLLLALAAKTVTGNIIYFFGYFAVYIASAVLILFVCVEIFRSALSAFPGLMKIGIVIFRWAIIVSVILTFSSISFTHRDFHVIADIAYSLMRSVSVLELCLLAFLCLSMNALRLTVRDTAFGIALGFGLMSANDFTSASLISARMPLTQPIEFVYQIVALVALCIWIGYCLMPSRVRKPVVMPASSAIYRWNEIASALGHTGTQVAIQQPANGFFLSDVEMVVDKVLTRNLQGRESEL